jgi:hypothetical protein
MTGAARKPDQWLSHMLEFQSWDKDPGKAEEKSWAAVTGKAINRYVVKLRTESCETILQ